MLVHQVIGDTSTRLIAIGAEAFKGPIELMRFIGLDRPAVDNGPDDLVSVNRSDFMFCINTVLSVVKRCSIPEDPDRAARGGFVAAFSESGNPVYRNPATPHIVPVLPPLFTLLRAMNALFLPTALSVLSEVSFALYHLYQFYQLNPSHYG
jgi:exportin-5